MSDLETRPGGDTGPWPSRSRGDDALGGAATGEGVGAGAADDVTHHPDDGQGDWGYGAYMSRWGDDGEAPTTRSSWIRLALLVVGVVALGVLFGLTLIAVIVALLISIALHELGHFLAAKWSGMKVTEYFIGFGPRIWSFRRGETEYGVKAIPAGAYVRIVGMNNLDRVDPADEGRTYRSKSYPKRLVTILAGPLTNIALGFLILVAVFSTFGAADDSLWSIKAVSPGSAAAAAGVQPGDRVVAVGGTPVASFDDLGRVLADKAGTATVVTVDRNGTSVDLPAQLGWRLSASGAAAIPGATAKDRITEVDGRPTGSYEEVAAALAAANGPVDLQIEHRGYLWSATVDGPIQLPADGKSGFFGVEPSRDVGTVRMNPIEAVGASGKALGAMTVGTVQGLGHLFSPSGISSYSNQVVDAASGSADQPKPLQVGSTTLTPIGPAPGSSSNGVTQSTDRPVSIVGIIQLGNSMAGLGWDKLLLLIATVNFALGFFNLIPLLPLDGGHAAVATYEAVRSRKGRPYRVDMAKLMPVTYLAVAMLLMFGLSAIFLDIRNPLTP
ncbi:MAG: site-2 protease family protein [Acidimicrobiales bacterium]